MDTKIVSWTLACALLIGCAGEAAAKKGGNGNGNGNGNGQWNSVAGNPIGTWNGAGLGSNNGQVRGNSPYIKSGNALGMYSKDAANLAKGLKSGAIQIGGSPNNVKFSYPGSSYKGRYVNDAYNAGNGNGLWNGNSNGNLRSNGQQLINQLHPTGQNRAAAQHLLNSTYKLNKQNGNWK